MSPKIQVIQLIDGFATTEASGGSALFAIRLARMLNKDLIKSIVCGLWRYNTASEQSWINQLAAEGIHARQLIETKSQLHFDLLRACHYLRSTVNRDEPIIINTHFERGDLLALAFKALYPTLRIAIVRTIHQNKLWLNRPWMGTLLNLVYPWMFEAEVAISKTTQNWLDQRPVARITRRYSTQIYNSLSHAEIEKFRRSHPTRESFAPPRFAIVGRLEVQKGHSFFLEAAALLLRTYPQAEFWIIGAGSLAETLQQQAHTLGINNAITWWGAQSDVAAHLREIDVLVSTSLWEGFPTIILEAMAASVPIIATDVSGSCELITSHETGLLIPVCDVPAVCAAMVWMIENPRAAEEMSKRAFDRLHDYALERTAAEYEDLYKNILHL